MMFPRIFDDAACPLEGYAGYTFRVLVNPTAQEKRDWALGDLGAPGCAECEKGRKIDPSFFCPSCTERRSLLGRAAHVVFLESKVQGFDFGTEEAALTSFSQPMPDEFLAWLYMLPGSVWDRRGEALKKTLSSPSETNAGSSST